MSTKEQIIKEASARIIAKGFFDTLDQFSSETSGNIKEASDNNRAEAEEKFLKLINEN